MKKPKTVKHAEPCMGHPRCEIWVKAASWDKNETSVKFAWPDRNGKAARGGEVPPSVLPQLLDVAIRENLLRIAHLKKHKTLWAQLHS